jgi:small subunit ribosomal protein S12
LQGRSKYGTKRPKPGAAPAKGGKGAPPAKGKK